MTAPRRRALSALALALAALGGSAGGLRAECHDSLMPFSSLQFRRSLGPELRGLGITGFGLTQPYRDATISTLLSSEVTLVIREQDNLAIEIGAQVPVPAEPEETAKFNALVSHIGARLGGGPEPELRARLLTSVLEHGAPGRWTETAGPVVLNYSRAADALLVKLRVQKCD